MRRSASSSAPIGPKDPGMTAPEPSSNGHSAAKGGPLRARGALPDRSEELTALGEALNARAEYVLDETRARTNDPDHPVEAVVQESFERICTSSTIAVARLIAGEDLDVAREAGRETWEVFGELAAQRAAPLDLVTRRCLWWRNVTAEVLCESAEELGVSAQGLSQAQDVLQMSLDFSLLRMAECFESERRRTDEELSQREQELAFLATHDALTGLPNRTLIIDRVEQMLARSARRDTSMVALFIDLDNFKAINDTLGHSAGDELLKAVAQRLDGVVRDGDALGRLGGDEFVVISEGISLDAGPELIAERLLEALKQPFELSGAGPASFKVNASVGIAMGDVASAEELLRHADIAMYRAKWDGKNRFATFESGMQDSVKARMELETDLRDALHYEEFFLVYQPTMALSPMNPTGVEALIRWRHTARGVLDPSDFIPMAEESGLIIEIGKWALEEACRQAAVWHAAGYPIGMAVNVSARQLDSDQIVGDIQAALSKSGLAAESLTIEITETTLMRNVEETAHRLRAIKALGVRIAIDDFGTGYSSLGHLKRFPVDALKIDRSFISELRSNQQGDAVIHTLVQLGKALSIETFAEGIEQNYELSLLTEEDCESGQGFLFARPLDVPGTEAFLKRWAESGAASLP
jgi:diguanylate cyclase (GGDEF)-like protein